MDTKDNGVGEVLPYYPFIKLVSQRNGFFHNIQPWAVFGCHELKLVPRAG